MSNLVISFHRGICLLMLNVEHYHVCWHYTNREDNIYYLTRLRGWRKEMNNISFVVINPSLKQQLARIRESKNWTVSHIEAALQPAEMNYQWLSQMMNAPEQQGTATQKQLMEGSRIQAGPQLEHRTWLWQVEHWEQLEEGNSGGGLNSKICNKKISNLQYLHDKKLSL